MSFSEKRYIGVALNGSSVKAVELAIGGTVKAKAVAEAKITPEIFNGGAAFNPQLLGELLRKMFKENGFSDAPLSFGIKNQNMIIRLANFPNVPSDKIASVVELQAQQFIPVPINDLNMDFIAYDPITQNGNSVIPVLLVCARKTHINSIMAAATLTPNEIINIDAGILSMVRAAKGHINGVTLIMDIDEEAINITVVEGETILLVRTVLLQQEFINYVNQFKNDPDSSETIVKMAEYIYTDLHGSIMYFKNSYGSSKEINKILICGDTKYLDKCVAIIQQNIDIEVSVPILFGNLNDIDLGIRLKYAECIGLALGAEG